MKRLLVLAALAATACTTVGPSYRSPEAAAPAQAPFAGANSPVFSGDQPSGPWWSLFADPVLDGLVRDALANNTDLRVAAAKLARHPWVLASARRRPALGLDPAAHPSMPALPALPSRPAPGPAAQAPAPLVEGLQQAIVGASRRPDLVEALERMEYRTLTSTPGAFAERIRADRDRWGPIVQDSGFKAED